MARILVIDDDADVRIALQDTLEISGHDVVALSCGDGALKAHSDLPVDIVVTDLFMPGKEGMETIADFRRHYPALPVIAISGLGPRDGSDYLQMANLLGARYVLGKPFTASELLEIIDTCVDAAA